VVAELELETAPFLISTAAVGGGVQAQRVAGGDGSNLMRAFDEETTGRRDR
jgi:general secretion pathway protein A